MKLKKEFSDFYKAIRIDSESHVLKEKREVLEEDIRSKLPGILADHGITLNSSDIHMIDQGSYKYHTTIKDDTQLLELLAQLLDVVADEAVVDIHIRSVIEDIQRAVNIDFQRSCDALCLRLLLIAQNVVEVFQNGHFLRFGISKVVLIDHADAPVNDGLLNRLQAVLAADNQLAHGEDEVGLQGQRVFLFGVVDIDVQRIDVVGTDG